MPEPTAVRKGPGPNCWMRVVGLVPQVKIWCFSPNLSNIINTYQQPLIHVRNLHSLSQAFKTNFPFKKSEPSVDATWKEEVHPWKLTWHWKITMCNRTFIFKWWSFDCYFSFHGGGGRCSFKLKFGGLRIHAVRIPFHIRLSTSASVVPTYGLNI